MDTTNKLLLKVVYSEIYKSSALLLSVVFESLKHCLVVVLVPLLIRLLNLPFHVLERILQHRREIGTHLVDTIAETVDFLLLFMLDVLNFSLDILLGLFKPLQLLGIVVLSLIQFVDLLGQVLLHRLVLPSHIRNDVHLRFLLLVALSLQHHFTHSLFFFSCFADIGFILLINVPSRQCLLHNHENCIAFLE